MEALTHEMFELIDDYDWKHHRKIKWTRNSTRFYKILVPSGQDVEVHTYAVKTRRDRTVVIHGVGRASVDSPVMQIRDLVFWQASGYQADWSLFGLGKRYISHNALGHWEEEPYNPTSGMWKVSSAPVINGEVLLTLDRFKYCGWTDRAGVDVLDYLKSYAARPRVELLAKAGLHRFCVMPGFCKRLETDKRFAKFVATHVEEIKRLRYGADVITRAYRRNITLAEAMKQIHDRREFKGMFLPREIDPAAAIAFCGDKSRWDYCRYLKNCARLGLDFKDTKVSFPRNLKARAKIVQDEVDQIVIRENAEKAAQMDRDIQAAALKFASVERIGARRSAFRVLLPKTNADFVREGKALKNCVGNGHYAAKMARLETLIAFIRTTDKPRTPFVTVEYSPDRRKILQCYVRSNGKPPAEVEAFVARRLLPAINRQAMRMKA